MSGPTDDSPAELVDRARRVLQQHVGFGGSSAVFHDDGFYPCFAERADGSRFWDIVGTEYVDWFLGGGPMTLGHRHPEVQAAAREQLERGAHLSIPPAIEVDVAEALCELIPCAEQVAFGKNGTDVTMAAVRVARAATGRDEVLMCGFHGFADWSLAARRNIEGIPAATGALVHPFSFGELERAEDLMRRRDGKVAAIIVEPVQETAPPDGFLAGLRALADRWSAALVFDEIVAGFRVANAGMQELSGVTPDLATYAKAMANGFPMAALVGQRHWMKHLRDASFGMTYRRDALTLAATRAALDVYRREDVPGHLRAIGEQLRGDFEALARDRGFDWSMSGLPAMLHLQLPGVGRLQPGGVMALVLESFKRAGVYVAPNRVLASFAHTQRDIDRTLEATALAIDNVRAAIDHGLHTVLDMPAYAALERTNDSGDASEEQRQIACVPYDNAGPLRSAGASFGVEAGATQQTCETGGDGWIVRARGGDGADFTSVLRFAGQIEGDVRVIASYRFPTWQPRNCELTLMLAANTFAGAHINVRHTLSLGGPGWTRVSGPGVDLLSPCTSGSGVAVMVIERRAGRWYCSHEIHGDLEPFVLPDVEDASPFRVVFRVRGKGRIDEVAIELTDLIVEPLTGG